ncbi:MAG: PEP-CTERM sorting domain-containing protein [Thiobacillus sp.]|nr:PEP-CTERM sorting domain-containing protein [Thiobacillus sp.]
MKTMPIRSIALAVSLLGCPPSVWAATSNVDVYGNINLLPTYSTYSAAADFGTNSFLLGESYTPLFNATSVSGGLAQIVGSDYTASASTTLSSNHAYVSANTIPTNVLSASSFSGWYDQVVITGGSGSGTASFTVQLNGVANVGATIGSIAYALGTSSIHPSQLTSDLIYFNAVTTSPWPMDAVSPITSYLLGASPYNDTSIVFGPSVLSPPSDLGIPTLSDPATSLGDLGMGFPVYDHVLTPGAGQIVNITLTGTLNFTYGEAFYLIGGLSASVLGDGLESFCAFGTIGSDTCTIPKDGTGATTLDFSNSANLVSIVLPQDATASFASGELYNVTAVPEPSEWLMLLAGLGLVGWRARRRS